MLCKARKLGLIDGTNVAIDPSNLTAYEYAVPKSKIPPKGINWNGQLVCYMNCVYVYSNNDNGTIKIVYPHAHGKCNCPMDSSWCSSSSSGYVCNVKIKDNPMFITAPFREAKAFEKLYNQ